MQQLPKTSPRPPCPDLPTPLFLGLIALIGAVALALDVVDLKNIPPGLHFDQAANGLLGLEILNGQTHPVFFSSYTGREALFMYVIAGVSALIGPGIVALRLAGALCGAATVIAVAFLGSALYRRRIGILAAAFLAGLYWQIQISRLGERTIMVPLLDALALLALWQAFRRRSLALAILGGGLTGLQLYTYPSSRFFLVALAAFAGVEVVGWAAGRVRPGYGRGSPPSPGLPHPQPLSIAMERGAGAAQGAAISPSPTALERGRGGEAATREMAPAPELAMPREAGWLRSPAILTIIVLLAAALATVPLALHFYHVPSDFLGRADEVAIWNARVAGPSPLAALGRSTLRTLGMFVIHGDADWKYNLANRPVFDPISAVWFLIGLALAIWRWRDRADRLCLIWWLCMLMPGFFSVDSPQFMRTLGAAPATVLFAARGLDLVVRWLRRLRFAPLRRIAPALWLWPLLAGVLATYQYFWVWAPSPAAYLALEGDVTAAARVIQAQSPKYAATYVASRYGPDPTESFLDGGLYSRLHWFDGRTVLPLPPPGAGPTLYVLPRSATDSYWYQRLPASARTADVLAPDGGPAVEAFVLKPGSIEPPADTAAPDLSFAGIARLIGADVPTAGQAGDPLFTTFYWRIEKPPSQEVKFFVHLVDSTGYTWAQYDASAYPAAEWRAGQTLLVRHPFVIPADAPIGTYRLQVGLEGASGEGLAAQGPGGKADGTFWTSAPISVIRPQRPPALSTLPIARKLNALFGGSVRLVGVAALPSRIQDGDSVDLTLFWQVVHAPGADLKTVIQARSRDGTVIATSAGPPTGGVWPAHDWKPGDVIVDRQRILIPAGTTPGQLALAVGLDDRNGEPLRPATGTAALVPIGSVSLRARPRSAVTVTISHRQAAAFQDGIRLLGYDLTPTSIQPRQAIQLTLYWQTERPVLRSWTVFTHLLDAQNQVRAQNDAVPVAGQRPTTTWAPGETIVDRHTLVVQPGTAAGDDQIEIGLYDPTTGARLQLTSGADRVVLDTPVAVSGCNRCATPGVVSSK